MSKEQSKHEVIELVIEQIPIGTLSNEKHDALCEFIRFNFETTESYQVFGMHHYVMRRKLPDVDVTPLQFRQSLLGLVSFDTSLYKLYNVCVTPALRGRGYGKRMMKEVLSVIQKQLPHIHCVYLDVNEDNANAHKVYSDVGFTEIAYVDAPKPIHYIMEYIFNDTPQEINKHE